MGRWRDAAAVRVRLKGDPDTLAETATDGALDVECRNYSIVPCEVSVGRLSSDDPKVATVTLAASAQVHMTRRRNHRWLNTPSTQTINAGTWSPAGVGETTVSAEVEVRNQSGARLGTATPDEDLEVTK